MHKIKAQYMQNAYICKCIKIMHNAKESYLTNQNFIKE